MTWVVGKTVTTRGTFKVSGALTDPTTVNLKVREPSGTETTYTYAATVTRDSLGVFSKAIALSSSGHWAFRWIGTGTVAAVDEASLEVEYSEFTTP